jgi:hypothetical protein
MKIKRYLFLIVLILFVSNITNANPLITIQKCADDKGTKEQLNFLAKWESLNTYEALLKIHSTNLSGHEEIIKIVEEELEYLSKINFIELQDEYLKHSSDVPHLRTLFGIYTDDVKWDDDDKNARLNKRIRSDFFKDYTRTKLSLEEKLRKHKVWEYQVNDEINKLKEMGEKKYNISFNKKIEEKRTNLENLLSQSLENKLKNENYKTYFFECEKERVTAPITFDYKWN